MSLGWGSKHCVLITLQKGRIGFLYSAVFSFYCFFCFLVSSVTFFASLSRTALQRFKIFPRRQILARVNLNNAQGRSVGGPGGPLIPPPPPFGRLFIFKWTTYKFRWQKGEEFSILWPQKLRLESSLLKFVSYKSILDMTMWWVPWVWHTGTPPLKNPGYVPDNALTDIEFNWFRSMASRRLQIKVPHLYFIQPHVEMLKDFCIKVHQCNYLKLAMVYCESWIWIGWLAMVYELIYQRPLIC